MVGVSIYTLVYTSFTAVFGPDIIRLHRVALGAEHGDNAHPPSLRSPSLEQHLPPGWASATVASSKRQYYYHAAQNIVQWNRPAPTAPDHLAVTRSNKPSFHHAVFNVTQWNPPPTPAPISTTTQVVTRLVVSWWCLTLMTRTHRSQPTATLWCPSPSIRRCLRQLEHSLWAAGPRLGGQMESVVPTLCI